MATYPYPGERVACVKESAIIESNIHEAFELVWDITRRHEWVNMIKEQRVIEKLSPETEIIYMKIGTLGLQSDYCLFQSRKAFNDGSIIIVGCSIDHKDAPISKKCTRGLLDLFTFFIEPISENSFKIYTVSQLSTESYGKIQRKLISSEFFLRNFSSQLLDLKKCLKRKKEKKEEKKRKK